MRVLRNLPAHTQGLRTSLNFILKTGARPREKRGLTIEMKVLYIIALIIAGGLSIAGQERVLTETEFTEIHSKAQADLYRGQYGPWRQVMETITSMEGRPELAYQLRSVTLHIPGQGSHRVENRTMGGKPSKYESVTLNDRSFTRTEDGQWKSVTAKPHSADEPAKEPAASLQAIDRRVDFKYNGTETYGGRKVHVYTKTEHKKSLHTASGSTSDSTSVTKVRISDDGKYYRFEANTDTLSGRAAASKVNIVIEVEADPTITITPPEAAK